MKFYIPIPTRHVCWPSGWLWNVVFSCVTAGVLSGKSSPCPERSQSLLRSTRPIVITALLAVTCDMPLHFHGPRGAGVAASSIETPVQSYQCSYVGSGWKWPQECSSPYSWAPQEAECHHLPPVWGVYEQDQGQGMKTNKWGKKQLIYKTLE